MGLPTNQAKGQGCSPVSSNCVIWQGPDIPCINLCHGDSVTDVVFKLATELCSIMDTLDIKTYDLTCFSPICPDPQNFHDMLQFLITKLCELQCCCDGTKPSESACPDACIVTVAPCFYFTNQLGDQITTMTLPEYVTAIGNKLCILAASTAVDSARIGAVLTEQATQSAEIISLRAGVEAVTVTLPASCLYPVDTPVEAGVTAIATELCNLEQATGSPIKILSAIQKECTNMDSLKTLANRAAVYSSIPGWVTSVNYLTLADSINNMWLTICDMRTSVENILATCCCTDCDDVNISFTATISGTNLTLFFTGSVPTGLTDCFPSGNFITVKDSSGGTYVGYVQVVNNLNGSVIIDLFGQPVNTALDLTITIQGCWKRPAPGSDCGGLECARILTYIIVNTAPCPTLTLIPAITTIAYNFLNMVTGPITYTVELYTSPGGVFVESANFVNPAFTSLVSGTFGLITPLIGGTNYFVQVRTNINGNITTCPQAFVTTVAQICLAPTVESASRVAP